MRSLQIADDDDDVVDAAPAQSGELIAQNRLAANRCQTFRAVRGVRQETTPGPAARMMAFVM